MSGDKVWLRLSSETLAKVDALKGRDARASSLRELIENGLSTPAEASVALDNSEGMPLHFTKTDAWAAEMAAWFLETAVRTWKMSHLPDDQPAWLVDSLTVNKAEWGMWAGSLRHLAARFKGLLPK